VSLEDALREAGKWAEAHTRDSWHVQLLVCEAGLAITVAMVPPSGAIEPISMSHGVSWLELTEFSGSENLLVHHMQEMYKQTKAELYRRMYSGDPQL